MRSLRNRARAGFTLVELLVVMAIIAILIGLLLPAVQKAREAASRTTCTNNCKQLALACLNYESGNRVWPYGDYRNTSGNPNNLQSYGKSPAISWRATILPYIEAQSVATIYNYNADWCSDQNAAAVAQQVKAFQCPSTPFPNRIESDGMEGPISPYGISTFNTTGVVFPPVLALTGVPGYCSDYWGINSVNCTVVTANPTQFSLGQVNAAQNGWTTANGTLEVAFGNSTLDFYAAATGVMTRGGNGQSRMADITDGTSNSLIFVESAGRPNQYGLGNQLIGPIANPGEGRWADPNGECKIKGSNPNTVANSTYINNGLTVPPGLHDKKNIVTALGVGTDLNVCSMNCNNINEPYSFHSTGCNFAFADGSVHFLLNNTPVYVLGQLATKSGAEPFQQGSIP